MFDIFGFGWGKLFIEVNGRVAAKVDGPSRLDLRPTFDRLFERSRHGRGAVSRREVQAWLFTARLLVLDAELEGFRASHRSYHESPDNGVMLLFVKVAARPGCNSSEIYQKRTCWRQGTRSGI